MNIRLKDQLDIPSDYAQWKLEDLIYHIIGKHHGYIRQQIPVIKFYLDQIVEAHAKTFPELEHIRTLFSSDAKDLLMHIEAEEEIVFPMIRDLAATPLDTASPSCVPLSFFQQMISAMEYDHLNEADRWKKISELTGDYKLQFEGSITPVAINLLKEFHNDLQHHMHLENDILFPGAKELKSNKIKALASKNQIAPI